METVSDNNPPAQSGAIGESAIYSYIYEYDNTPYEYDNTQECSLLEALLQEGISQNEILLHISESLDQLNESLHPADELEAAPELDAPDTVEIEIEGTETYRESVMSMLESMDSSLSFLAETGEGIGSTVSGNSLYLDDISSTTSCIMELYSESSSQQSYTGTYGLSIGIGLTFIGSAITGLLIARAVWGKMR